MQLLLDFKQPQSKRRHFCFLSEHLNKRDHTLQHNNDPCKSYKISFGLKVNWLAPVKTISNVFFVVQESADLGFLFVCFVGFPSFVCKLIICILKPQLITVL